MNYFRKISQIALLVGAFALSANAADNTMLEGRIESVDAANRSFVMKSTKTGEMLTVKAANTKVPIHVYAKGTMDDVKPGTDLKVYGKVEPDLSAINKVSSICVMPYASTHTDKKGRVDGKLLVNGGKWYLQRKDDETAVSLGGKVSVTKVIDVGFDFLEKGMKMRCLCVEKDGAYVAKWDMRNYAPREKAEAYAASKAKDK